MILIISIQSHLPHTHTQHNVDNTKGLRARDHLRILPIMDANSWGKPVVQTRQLQNLMSIMGTTLCLQGNFPSDSIHTNQSKSINPLRHDDMQALLLCLRWEEELRVRVAASLALQPGQEDALHSNWETNTILTSDKFNWEMNAAKTN